MDVTRFLPITDIDPVIGYGALAALIVTFSLVVIELRNCFKSNSVISSLDKIWIAARTRALLRSAFLLTWFSSIVGLGWALVMLTTIGLAHGAASVIRYSIDSIAQATPIIPIANLKSEKSYKKVWAKLGKLKKFRTRLLYSFDLVAVSAHLAVLAVLNFVGLSDQLTIVAGLSVQVVLMLFILLASYKTYKRRRSFIADGVQERIQNKVLKELTKKKPQVMLYFSGPAANRYQLEQWLGPIEKLKKNVVIALRETANAKNFPKTKWPVVVAKSISQFEAATVDSIKVVLYVSNAAKNNHPLALGHLTHIHLNHGDSDKASSYNRYSKVYDCLLYTSPSPRDRTRSRMPSSA